MNLIRKQKFIKEGPDLKFYLAEIIVAVEQLHGKNARSLTFLCRLKHRVPRPQTPEHTA
jgi:hypothetical protein